MTHDKLLAKIDGFGSGDVLYDALRAVVELHHAVELEPDGYPIVFCQNCFDDAGHQEPYPCPTIQSIEKKLS